MTGGVLAAAAGGSEPLAGPIVVALLVMIIVACAVAITIVWRWMPRRIVELVPQLADASALLQARVWATFVLVATIIGAVPILLARRESTLGYALRALRPTEIGDSWAPMFEALDSLVHRPGVPVYDAVWETGYKFQYPLMSVLPVDPLIRFFGMDREAFHASLNVASWIAFAVLGALTAVLWARLHGPRDAAFWQVVPPRSLIVLAPAGILGAMVFFPITRGLHLGQIQTTLTVLVGISLLAWCTGNKVVAGIALALCCIVKPQWVIIALWALLRREWRFVIAGVVTAGAAFALSIVVYGVEQVLSYADLLLRLGSSGETFYANQSVNGLLNRLLFNGESLHFSHSELAPDHPVVAAGTAISVVVILLFALLWRVRSSPTTLDLSTAVLSLTIAAPIAWEHHYGVAYAVFAVLMVAQFREGSPGRPVIVFTGIAYVLISQNLFPIVNATHDSGWNILQSYMFFGGIILLALLYVQSARAQSVELPARRISVPAPIGDPAA